MRDVFFLSSGQLKAPALAVTPAREDGAPHTGARFRTKVLSNTVAVAERDSGEVVLVDCGWSEATCRDPVGELGRLQATVVGIDASPGESVVAQLSRFGVDPSRVSTIIATHLHIDHIGGACDFPNAEIVTTDRELTAYRTLGRRAGYRAQDLANASRLRLVSLVNRPTYGFASSYDLFGDGEIVLLDARGHTRGSIACALRTRERNYVHVGDAAFQTWEYGLSPQGPCLTARATMWSKRDVLATYQCIRDCEADPRRPIIVPSHDVTVFEKLPHRPRAIAKAAE